MSPIHKKLSLVLALLSLLPSLPAFADTFPNGPAPMVSEPRRWGLGIQIGAPTGLTLKRYLGRDAIDFYVGGVYGPGLRVGADYLFGLAQLADSPSVNLDLYVGVGPFVGLLRGPCAGVSSWPGTCDGDGYLGGRVPIGLELVSKRAPFSLGLELAPAFAVAPNRAGVLLDVNLAARVLF
jgi:hypothetical protein